jgi:putative transposase
MRVMEAKLLNGTAEQYQALDEAIRTAQFVRNKCVRYWMDNGGAGRNQLYTHCKDLAKEFAFAKKLNSSARQASAERAWTAISRFYANCKNKEVKERLSQVQEALPFGRVQSIRLEAVSGWNVHHIH